MERLHSSVEQKVDYRKRIVLSCTHSFGARFFEGQLQYLYNSGFDVYVISSPGKEIEALCKKEHATFVPFHFTRSINPVTDFKAVIGVAKLLRTIKPDLINAGTPKAGLVVVLAGRLLNICPIIFTLRGLRSDTMTGWKGKLVRSMEKLTCAMADKTICISPSLALHANNQHIVPPRKTVVLHKGSSNGINVDRFVTGVEVVEQVASLKEQLRLSSTDFIMGYVGRVNNDKGVVELFNAFKQLRAKYAEVKLVLVGKFEEEDAVPDHIVTEIKMHPDVRILSYTDRVEVAYALFDVLVLYSKREGFGNVLIEAAAMEVPVIAADIPGCRDAVAHNHAGFLVNRTNTDDLVDKLALYITDPALKLAHGKNGRIWVTENFKSELIWSQQTEFYKQMMNDK